MNAHLPLDIQPYLIDLERIDPFRSTGVVVQLIGLLIESAGPSVAIGAPRPSAFPVRGGMPTAA